MYHFKKSQFAGMLRSIWLTGVQLLFLASCSNAQFEYTGQKDPNVAVDEISKAQEDQEIKKEFFFQADPQPAKTGETIFFTATCRLESPSVTWDFGVDGEKEGLTTDHKYETAGTYTVKATCTGSSGKVLETEAQVTVGENNTNQF